MGEHRNAAAELTAAPAWAGLVLGTLLIGSPETGTAAGLGVDRGAIRAAGAVDLVLGIALRTGRRPRAWMIGRVLGNVLVAALAAGNLARQGPSRGWSGALIAALAVFTLLDVRVLHGLRALRESAARQ